MIEELKEKWEELFVRFNTSPKLYQKIDFLKLIKFLQEMLDDSDYGAVHEEDLKTLADQPLVGKGQNIPLKTLSEQALIGEGDIKLKTLDGESLIGEGDIQVKTEPLQQITYAELKELRDNAELTPGIQYQITDYVTTSTESETECAGHLFDIIVTADSTDKLSELARACQHEGESYFANSNLAAWQLKYCLDNDTDRFGWADEENGKGVIYRLTDERNNSCPFDFKNIKFRYDPGNNSSPCVYTFSIGAVMEGSKAYQDMYGIDFSMSDIYYVYDNYVADNHMKVYHPDQWYDGGSGITSASGYGITGACVYTDVLQLPFIYFIGPMTAGSHISADSCFIKFVPEKITDMTYIGQSGRNSYVSRCAVQNMKVISAGVGAWSGYLIKGPTTQLTVSV